MSSLSKLFANLMWILGLNAITKYVFFNNVMKVKIWKEAYPIVRKTPFLVCSETWEGIEIGWRSGILMSLYIFIILSIPLYSIITKIDFYNAWDAEMIGLILSNASYYNGAGNLGEWNLSHKDTINCPEKLMKISHFNQTNQRLLSLLW